MRANGDGELVFRMNEWALSVLASRHLSVGESCESMEPLTQDMAEMSVTVYSLTRVVPTDPTLFSVPLLYFVPQPQPFLAIVIARFFLKINLLLFISKNSLTFHCH